MMVIANTVFSDEKNGSDVISTLSDIQLGANLVKSLKTGFEPCVSFISNPFMQVDLTCIAEQLSATFNVDAGHVEIEILTLQYDLHLKAHQDAPNF
ncbi:hypothetical protein F7725_012027, partial [Dissostichus mawsoni]